QPSDPEPSADPASGGAGGGAAQPGSSTGGAAGAGGMSTGGAGAGTSGAPGQEQPSNSGADPHGILQLYPAAASGARWTSEHWAQNAPYVLDGRADPFDPAGISGARGTGTLEVAEGGELVFGGSQPRIYVYASDVGPWQDVEVT